MTQTESFLLLGLGFATALAVAMIAGFVMWQAADRWSARQRRHEVPSIILNLQGEREALRAQMAMTTRRLEFLLDEARDQAAEKTAEVTRHRNRAVIIAKNIRAKDAEVKALQAMVVELTDETNRRAKIIARLTGREAKKLRSVEFPSMGQIARANLNGALPEAPTKVMNTIMELNALSSKIANQNAAQDESTPADSESAEIEAEDLPGASADGEALEQDAMAQAVPARPATLADRFRALKGGIQA